MENSKIQPYQVYTYRTKDGDAYFQFSYHETADGFEIDIHSNPDYRENDSGSHTAHWLPSSREADRMICIKREFYPKTLKDAQDFSMAWAELTWTYIKTGISLDRQIEMQN